MFLRRLGLRDFRSWAEVELSLAPGLTVVVGDNGAGKTNLLEAIGYLATMRSTRGAPTEALVRLGQERAIVRAAGDVAGRALLLEAEIVAAGRSRMLVNKQPLARHRDLRDGLVVTVFSPDDLVLVKGGPAERRGYLDDVLSIIHPRNQALLADLDRIVRQRNALLKQAGGRLDESAALTLDVWDAHLGVVGEQVIAARQSLLDALAPLVQEAYAAIADRPAMISVRSAPTAAAGTLALALEQARGDDVRRGLTTLGPQRDDVVLLIEGRPSRTHASQGEQRSLSLALRLATHRYLAEVLGVPPVLLLDDVFSELDPHRCDALVRHLPAGQAVLATAGFVPTAAEVEARVEVRRGVPGGLDGAVSEIISSSAAVDRPVESVDERS